MAAASAQPFTITRAQWNAAQTQLADLQEQIDALRAATGVEDDADADDSLVEDFADDVDDVEDDATVIEADDDDSGDFAQGYYFNEDDTRAAYIDGEGYAFEVAASGKPSSEYLEDMEGFDDYAGNAPGDITIKAVRERLAAANAAPEPEPAPAPRRRAAQATAAVASAGPRKVSDLDANELKETVTKHGGDPAKIVQGLHARARTNTLRVWLTAFLRAKREHDPAQARRMATKAANDAAGARSMG